MDEDNKGTINITKLYLLIFEDEIKTEIKMWFEYNNRQISLGRDEYAVNILSSRQDFSRQGLELTIGDMDISVRSG